MEMTMKTVQMTLDEELLEEVDLVSGKLKTSRSAFARHALKDAVERYYTQQREQQQREGYLRHPVAREEFGDWEAEQQWGDE